MGTGIEEVGARLREQLEELDQTITWLQAEMESRGVAGSGYSNVQRYVAGERGSAPPTAWIEAAADILGVRAGWLAFGEGARTEELETWRKVTVRDTVRWRQNRDGDLESAAGEVGLRLDRGWAGWPLLLEAGRRTQQLHAFRGQIPEADEVARAVGTAILAPLEVLEVRSLVWDGPGARDARERYVVQVVAALNAILPRTAEDAIATLGGEKA